MSSTWTHDTNFLKRRILNTKSQKLPQAAVGNTASHFGAVTPAKGSLIPQDSCYKVSADRIPALCLLTAAHTFGHDSTRQSTTQPHTPKHARSRTPLTSDVRTRCASGIGEGSLDIPHRTDVLWTAEIADSRMMQLDYLPSLVQTSSLPSISHEPPQV